MKSARFSEAKKDEDLLALLLELQAEIAKTRLAIETKSGKSGKMGKAEEQELYQHILCLKAAKEAKVKLSSPQSRAVLERLGADLVDLCADAPVNHRSMLAKLYDIKAEALFESKKTAILSIYNNAIAAEVDDVLLEVMVDTYIQEMSQDKVWGGEGEADLVARAVGFACGIFVVIGGKYHRMASIGAVPEGHFHLLHSGNHYDVITHSRPDGVDYHQNTQVMPINKDGNCLYNSLRQVAWRAQKNKTRNELRRIASEQLELHREDVAVPIIINLIASGNTAGLGPKMQKLSGDVTAPDKGASGLSKRLWGGKGHGVDVAHKKTWTQFLNQTGALNSSFAFLADLVADTRLRATLVARNMLITDFKKYDGVGLHVLQVKKGVEAQKGAAGSPYPVVAAQHGSEDHYDSEGRQSSAEKHAEGRWWQDVQSTITTLAKDVLFIEAHDTFAPCTEYCDHGMIALGALLDVPIIVWSYKDWGHLTNSILELKNMCQTLMSPATARDSTTLIDKHYKDMAPIMLYNDQGGFIIGLWAPHANVTNAVFFEKKGK